MLEGKKTYIGLLVAALGTLGVFKFFTQTETASLLNNLLEIGGILFAAYGRYAVKPK